MFVHVTVMQVSDVATLRSSFSLELLDLPQREVLISAVGNITAQTTCIVENRWKRGEEISK